jgi:hypothetical protein
MGSRNIRIIQTSSSKNWRCYSKAFKYCIYREIEIYKYPNTATA